MNDKIGSPVLKSRNVLTEKWMGHEERSRHKVLAVLKEVDKELSITQISHRANLSWVTTKNALLELIMLGLVEGKREGNALKFKIKIK